MNKAIIGKKLAMSQIFAPDGTVIPVTIVLAGPCPVVQKKTLDNDGYEAVQIAFGEIKEKNVNKPIKGHYKKAGVAPRRVLREFKTDVANYELGQELKCDQFAEGSLVDVAELQRDTDLPALSRDGIITADLWRTVRVTTEA